MHPVLVVTKIVWKGFIIMKLTTIQAAKSAARQKIFEFIKQRIEHLFEKKIPVPLGNF